jgi:hypothetical protein
MLVILAYQNDASAKVNEQGEAAEEWLRATLTYLRNAPGVWIQPLTLPANTPKWRALNQRMVDVAVGLGAENGIVVTHPDWLREGDQRLIFGGNVVYAVSSLEGVPLDLAPFILFLDDPSRAASAVPGDVWTLTRPGSDLRAWAPLWQRSRGCR